jgi:ribokinase
MSERPFGVCVVGSANLDLVATADTLPAPGETVLGNGYAEHPGGKGLNQAVADGVAKGRALIGVAASGENSIIVVPGANATVEVDTVPDSSVVLAQLEVPLATIETAFRLARQAGAMTVLNPAPAQPLDAALLALCDVVVPNEHEAELLGGVDALLAMGANAVVTTQGAAGATLTTRDGSTAIAPFTVDARDTTAAGDTFCGALCARLAAGDDLPTALRFASAAAAISTTRAGAVPSIPHADEVVALLARTSDTIIDRG